MRTTSMIRGSHLRFAGALAFVTVAITSVVRAQSDPRTELARLLRFKYVSQPNNPDTVNYRPALLDNAAIAAGREVGAFWTSPAMTGPQRLVRALLRDQAGGGDV